MREHRHPVFQQRHYEELAAFIKTEGAAIPQSVITRLVRVLARDNPKFKLDRFAKACGLDQQTLTNENF